MSAATSIRPGALVSIRQVADLADVHPKTMKNRLKARDASARAAGEEEVLLRFGKNGTGKLFTTLERCRRVFGQEFARVDLADRVAKLETEKRALRRDLNRSLAQMREFQQKALAWFKRLEKDQEPKVEAPSGADVAPAQNRPESTRNLREGFVGVEQRRR